MSRDPFPAVEGVTNFWTRVREAPHRLLGLDYDGTLAPFHVIREAAVPVPGAKEVLIEIQRQANTDLILVTGRPAQEVRDLLGPELQVPVIGVHGYEYMRADGTLDVQPPDAMQLAGLARAWDIAVSIGQEKHLEKKVSSLALHTREVPEAAEIESTLEELWWPLTQEYELAILRFNGGVELRARGRNKGLAFAAHYATMPKGTLPVYIGDDTTDEDVFRYLRPIGIGIKVGEDTAITEAAGRLPNPEAVLRLLQGWRLACAGGQEI